MAHRVDPRIDPEGKRLPIKLGPRSRSPGNGFDTSFITHCP